MYFGDERILNINTKRYWHWMNANMTITAKVCARLPTTQWARPRWTTLCVRLAIASMEYLPRCILGFYVPVIKRTAFGLSGGFPDGDPHEALFVFLQSQPSQRLTSELHGRYTILGRRLPGKKTSTEPHTRKIQVRSQSAQIVYSTYDLEPKILARKINNKRTTWHHHRIQSICTPVSTQRLTC